MNQNRLVTTALFGCALIGALSISACSRTPRNVKPVKGKVTLGGQPVEGALVMFNPKASGSPSAARTNSSGEYELIFTRDVKGAEMGEHVVTISTHQDAQPDADTPKPEVPERIPLKYREGPEQLKADVKAGENIIDFTLEPGPVDPPPVKGKKVKKSPNACN